MAGTPGVAMMGPVESDREASLDRPREAKTAAPAQGVAARIGTLWLALPANFRGILLLAGGAFLLTSSDTFVKALGAKFTPYELSFYRYATGMIVLTPLFVQLGWHGLKTARIGMHGLRMGLAFVAQIGVFYTIIHMPLADATAFMFSKPLFTTLVAVIVLSELVNARRWIATAVGFLGVLVMMRPGSEGIDPVALIAVGTALIFAIANVLIRILAVTEPTNRMLFYYHIGGVAVFAGPTIWAGQTPAGLEWLLLLAIGVLTTGGMFCYFRAFSIGEANAVGPAENLRLIYAALLGFLLFAEIPSPWTVVGATIIVGSTYYIARVEAKGGGNR